MRRLVIAWFVIGAMAAPAAQQPQQPSTFRATARLIVQSVIVKDRAGKPIAGLTAEDFVVTENDQPQKVAFVEYQSLPTTPLPPMSEAITVDLPDRPAAAAPVVAPVTGGAVAVPAAGDTRYRDKRLLVLYFDILNAGFFDQIRMYDQARRYVATRMTSADMVAIMLFESSSVKVLQDFTDDRERLNAVIESLAAAADDRQNGSGQVETASAFGQDNETFNIFSTDRQLAALQTAVTDLGPLPQVKTLVYLGSGLRLNGADNMAQMRATVNAAVRSNVTINPIDTRGLTATPPLGDATRPSPGGIGMFNGMIAQASITRQQRSQDTYYALAKDTGGRALFDNNDLALGISQAAEAVTGYYMLGYYSAHADRDGRFRRVKVALARPLGAELSYRAGYYGEKDYGRFTRADRERQLEEALKLDDPITDIPMAIEVNYFQLNRAEYFVPVSVRMPAADLARARPSGAIDAEIDMIGEIKDEYGVTQRNVRDKVEFKLDAAAASQVANRTIQYELGFTLLPGKYTIKLLARDATAGRIGTFLTAFDVPNLERATAELPISTVILSNQRQPYAEALHTVRQKIAGDTANPLVYEGQKLIPSVARAFGTARPLYVFLQAYQRGETAMRPLVAFVTFYRDGVKAFESDTMALKDGWDPVTRAVPIRFEIPLAGLQPGNYDCQVTVLDPASGRAAFWRAPIVLR